MKYDSTKCDVIFNKNSYVMGLVIFCLDYFYDQNWDLSQIENHLNRITVRDSSYTSGPWYEMNDSTHFSYNYCHLNDSEILCWIFSYSSFMFQGFPTLRRHGSPPYLSCSCDIIEATAPRSNISTVYVAFEVDRTFLTLSPLASPQRLQITCDKHTASESYQNEFCTTEEHGIWRCWYLSLSVYIPRGVDTDRVQKDFSFLASRRREA